MKNKMNFQFKKIRFFLKDKIFVTCAFLLTFCMGSVNACEIASSGNTICFDSEGNGIQVWSELTEDGYVIKSSFYNTDHGWLDPEIISPDGISSELPVLAVDDNWNCVLLWVYVDPELGYNRLYAMTKISSESWSKPEIISILEEKVITNSYKIILDKNKRILILWDSLIDVEGPEVFRQIGRSCRSSFGSSWDEPQTIRVSVIAPKQGSKILKSKNEDK